MANTGGVYTWSKTPAANAGADNTVNWQEGQPPSSVNDSARAMMTSVAKYRDDISGAVVTTGTAAAYQVASNQKFDTLVNFHGQVIAFTPHVTNAAGPVTMTVDGFANLPLRTAPGTELPAGILIQGTPYAATYNNTDGSLYLHGLFGNPYNVPLAAGMDYWGPTAPNSAFAFPIGQPISRTTYAALFALIGTTYGPGNGTTTFNLPDKRGRVSAALDSGAGRLTDVVAGFGDTLGEAGGNQIHTLVASQIPTITSGVSVSGSLTGQTNSFLVVQNGSTTGGGSFSIAGSVVNQNIGVSVSGSMSGSATSNNTGGNAHPNVQPTICCNYIMRIL